MNLFKYGILFLSFSLLSVPSLAARTASHCSLEGEGPRAHIEGLHHNERLPIGSVSKLVTTYWAIATMKPDFRFSTRIYISPIPGQDSSIVDLHFEGSRDPYFGKESLHYLASELNKMKINKIRNLTFDSHFKFFWNVSGGPTMTPGTNPVETGYYGPDAPTPTQVARELKRYRSNLAYGYSTTRAYLKKFNIELIANARLSVKEINHVPAEEFKAPENTITRMIHSSPIVSLLKEMNQNSNNHAANQIFEHLGNTEKFQEFINADGFTDNDILFVNGHGNRKDIDTNESVYNEASCETILKIMTRLRIKLLDVNMDIDDVLAVPGVDQRTTLGAYQDKPYADSMAAKTGTIGPAVTLAGMLQTKNGPVFFMYNMSTAGTKRDWSRARKAIAAQLTNLTKKHNGGTPLDAKGVKFVAFDPELFFQEDDWNAETESPDLAATSEKAAPTSVATIPQIGPNFNLPAKSAVKSKSQTAQPTESKSVPKTDRTVQPLKTYKLAQPKPVDRTKKAQSVSKKSTGKKSEAKKVVKTKNGKKTKSPIVVS